MSAADIPLEIYLLSKFDRSGTLFDISERTDNVYFATWILGGLQLLLYIAAGISVALLLRRVVNNGAQIVPHQAKHKAHWAITGWLVPFLNLIRPYEMVKQAWVTSRSTDPASRNEDPPDFFKLWWGLFITMIIADRIARRFSSADVWTMDQLANETIAVLIAQSLSVCTGVAFILVLRSLIDRHQLAIDSPWHRTPTGPAIVVKPENEPPVSWNRRPYR